MTFGQRIRQARKRANMSAEDLADAMCVSRVTVYHWEKGIRNMPAKRTRRLLDVFLWANPWWLLGNIGDMER